MRINVTTDTEIFHVMAIAIAKALNYPPEAFKEEIINRINDHHTHLSAYIEAVQSNWELSNERVDLTVLAEILQRPILIINDQTISNPEALDIFETEPLLIDKNGDGYRTVITEINHNGLREQWRRRKLRKILQPTEVVISISNHSITGDSVMGANSLTSPLGCYQENKIPPPSREYDEFNDFRVPDNQLVFINAQNLTHLSEKARANIIEIAAGMPTYSARVMIWERSQKGGHAAMILRDAEKYYYVSLYHQSQCCGYAHCGCLTPSFYRAYRYGDAQGNGQPPTFIDNPALLDPPSFALYKKSYANVTLSIKERWQAVNRNLPWYQRWKQQIALSFSTERALDYFEKLPETDRVPLAAANEKFEQLQQVRKWTTASNTIRNHPSDAMAAHLYEVTRQNTVPPNLFSPLEEVINTMGEHNQYLQRAQREEEPGKILQCLEAIKNFIFCFCCFEKKATRNTSAQFPELKAHPDYVIQIERNMFQLRAMICFYLQFLESDPKWRLLGDCCCLTTRYQNCTTLCHNILKAGDVFDEIKIEETSIFLLKHSTHYIQSTDNKRNIILRLEENNDIKALYPKEKILPLTTEYRAILREKLSNPNLAFVIIKRAENRELFDRILQEAESQSSSVIHTCFQYMGYYIGKNLHQCLHGFLLCHVFAFCFSCAANKENTAWKKFGKYSMYLLIQFSIQWVLLYLLDNKFFKDNLTPKEEVVASLLLIALRAAILVILPILKYFSNLTGLTNMDDVVPKEFKNSLFALSRTQPDIVKIIQTKESMTRTISFVH